MRMYSLKYVVFINHLAKQSNARPIKQTNVDSKIIKHTHITTVANR